MPRQAPRLVVIALSALSGAAGFALVSGQFAPVHAADDTRQQRMDEGNWTTGDRARDALNHLQKAEAHMSRVARDNDSKVAKDAAQLCADARTKVDQFLEDLKDREKRK